MFKKFINYNTNGFTLVEMLIVVVLIGTLAGITVTVINPTAQRNKADDGVRQANLEKLVQGVEAFNVAEGRYPISTTDPALATYISAWPTSPAFTYQRNQVGTQGTSACLSVAMATNAALNFKYINPYKAGSGSNTCIGTILKDCPTSCSAGVNSAFNIQSCKKLDGQLCT